MDIADIIKKCEEDVNEIHNLVTVGPHTIERETDTLSKIIAIANQIGENYFTKCLEENLKLKKNCSYIILQLIIRFIIIMLIIFLIPYGVLFAPFLMYVSFKNINKKLKELQKTSNDLNDFAKKAEVLNNRLVNYEEITISRLDKLIEDEKEKEHEQLTYIFDEMLAKFLIDDYFKNKPINLNQIPIEIRQTMIKILQEDLQDSSENLTELLEKARIKSLNNGFTRELKHN